MFSFLFRSTTYIILWKKFKKQIILLALSLVAILVIDNIYSDLFDVLKVSNKDSLIWLLVIKWNLVLMIIWINIKKFKQVDISDKEKKEIFKDDIKIFPKKSQEIMKKKEALKTTTDLILKKYEKENI